MLPVIPGLRFYLYTEPTDMRKSFDGLSGIVTNERLGNPISGDVFIFINRRRDRIKFLVWDRSGFWLFYKRLEKGSFQIPPKLSERASIELSYDVLLMLVEGIDYTRVKRRPRYHQHTG
jgi:transposase